MGWCRGGKVDGWARGRADGKAGAGAGSHLLNTKHRRWLPAPALQPQHKGGDRQDADKQADDDITCPHIGTGKTFNQVCVKILSATARINNKL